MPVTDVDIANMALGLLNEAQIDSLDDDTLAARACNLHYDTTREAELEAHDWVFAIQSATLVGSDLGSGSGTYNWEYELPVDALRILPLTYDGEPHGLPISWRVNGGLLYSDQSSPRVIHYIANIIDPNDWDALFTEVLVAALAIKIAHPITHKTSMIEIAQRAYDRALQRALRANAIQRQGRLYEAGWHAQRGDTRVGWW